MGHGPLDIALWDLAGKRMGDFGRRAARRLPHAPADLCQHLSRPGRARRPRHARGLRRLRGRLQGAGLRRLQDPWLARRRRRARGCGTCSASRKAVGDGWPLMIDPACELRTWMDALHVGRACDEAGYFWYEDPYRDSGVSVDGHKRLREKLKTPLLVSEHVRGLEQKAAVHARRRLRHDPRRPGIRHGHHRGDEDRPFLRGARARRPVPRLRPGAPRGAWPRRATPTSTRWR